METNIQTGKSTFHQKHQERLSSTVDTQRSKYESQNPRFNRVKRKNDINLKKKLKSLTNEKLKDDTVKINSHIDKFFGPTANPNKPVATAFSRVSQRDINNSRNDSQPRGSSLPFLTNQSKLSGGYSFDRSRMVTNMTNKTQQDTTNFSRRDSALGRLESAMRKKKQFALPLHKLGSDKKGSNLLGSIGNQFSDSKYSASLIQAMVINKYRREGMNSSVFKPRGEISTLQNLYNDRSRSNFSESQNSFKNDKHHYYQEYDNRWDPDSFKPNKARSMARKESVKRLFKLKENVFGSKRASVGNRSAFQLSPANSAMNIHQSDRLTTNASGEILPPLGLQQIALKYDNRPSHIQSQSLIPTNVDPRQFETRNTLNSSQKMLKSNSSGALQLTTPEDNSRLSATLPSKQELCAQLDEIGPHKHFNSPTRITRLYALIQTQARKDKVFQESLRLSEDRLKKVNDVDQKIASNIVPLKHKDAISRVSEAIDRYKNMHSDVLTSSYLDEFKNESGLQSPERAEHGSKYLWKVRQSHDQQPIEEKSEKTDDGKYEHMLQEIRKATPEMLTERPTKKFTFRDNIDVSDFMRMDAIKKWELEVDHTELDYVLKENYPMWIKNGQTRKVLPVEAELTGFWHKLPLRGSQQPVGRDQACMVFQQKLGVPTLSIFGGCVATTGAKPFEGYEIDLESYNWKKYNITGAQLQPQGTKPVYHINPRTDDITVYQFGGAAPMDRINSGVRLCMIDMMKFSTANCVMDKVKVNNFKDLVGRKNFAISYCTDFVFVTGGMDHKTRHLSDIWAYNVVEFEWKYLTQKRVASDHKDDEINKTMFERRDSLRSMRSHTTVVTNKTKSHLSSTELTEKTPMNIRESYGNEDIWKGEGTTIVKDEDAKKKRKKLLQRSHHSMNTCVRKAMRLKGGYKVCYFKSYVFGGFVQDDSGTFHTSNDLIEVSTVAVLVDLKYKGKFSHLDKPVVPKKQENQAQVKLIKEAKGRKPMPRRDHSSQLVSNNRYLLIYGGKNDDAYKKSPVDANYKGNLLDFNPDSLLPLDDLMIFNIEKREWSAIAQMGFRPEGRWNAALACNDDSQQLFIFGGSNHQGSLRNEIYCCELHPVNVNSQKTIYKDAIADIHDCERRLTAAKQKDSVHYI